MIHLVQKENRALYARYLKALASSEPSEAGSALEVNQPQSEAFILLALAADDAVSGAVSLRFRQDDDPRPGAQVVEAQRVAVGAGAEPGLDQGNALLLAVLEFALAQGAARIRLTPPATWSSFLPGAPWLLGGEDETALELECDGAVLDRLRLEAGATGPVLLTIEPNVFPSHLTPLEIESLIKSQDALTAVEITDILKLSKSLSPQDNKVFARIASHLAAIMDREGEDARSRPSPASTASSSGALKQSRTC